ncbi:MAG TPA: hypothetical protein QGH10_02170 [Armatimonadota bacterium]|nr:hypothetical protein [Armatimonadota bacterium]
MYRRGWGWLVGLVLVGGGVYLSIFHGSRGRAPSERGPSSRSGTASVSESSPDLDSHYVLAVTRYSSALQEEEIWVLALGAEPEVVARFPGQLPMWSPDGSRLAIGRRDGDGPTQVWTCDPLGDAARPVTDTDMSEGMASHEAWSPDGRRIYYTSGYGETSPNLWAHDLESNAAMAVSQAGPYYAYVRPSPDGEWIAATQMAIHSPGRRVGVVVMATDRPTHRPFIDPGEWASLVGWSSDSKWVYIQTVTGATETKMELIDEEVLEAAKALAGAEAGLAIATIFEKAGVRIDLERVTRDGKTREVIVEGDPMILEATCGPDGTLAYTSVTSGDDRLTLIPGPGRGEMRLGPMADQGFDIQFSPDGKLIACLYASDGKTPRDAEVSGLVVCDLATGDERLVLPTDDDWVSTLFDWRPVVPASGLPDGWSGE